MISSDWLYCLAGIVGSFLISLFFYWLGGYEKILFIDMIADNRYSEIHDCVCMMKNIGRNTVTMSDFAPKDMPHFMTEGLEAFDVIPPGKANINGVQAERDNNDVYVTFDYLRHGEQLFLLLKGQKGLTGYRATQIYGKPIYYQYVKKRISTITGVLSAGSILSIAMLLFSLNTSRELFLFVIGVLVVVFALSNICSLQLKKSHEELMKKMQEVN